VAALGAGELERANALSKKKIIPLSYQERGIQGMR